MKLARSTSSKSRQEGPRPRHIDYSTPNGLGVTDDAKTIVRPPRVAPPSGSRAHYQPHCSTPLCNTPLQALTDAASHTTIPMSTVLSLAPPAPRDRHPAPLLTPRQCSRQQTSPLTQTAWRSFNLTATCMPDRMSRSFAFLQTRKLTTRTAEACAKRKCIR